MRRLKKGFCFIVVLSAAFVLQACGNKGEKYVEQYIKEGKYNEVYILVNEFDIEKTGKMGDLIADVDNYNNVVSLLHGQSSENDLEEAKRQILGFNGSYKKYSSFEEDVEELENRIVELENHRNEIEEIIQKIQDSYDSGNYESMGKVITEYKENEMLVADTSMEQSERLEQLIIQYESYQKKESEEGAVDFQPEWVGGVSNQTELEQNQPKDSIDTEMDIVE
jgi:hypothetical protein